MVPFCTNVYVGAPAVFLTRSTIAPDRDLKVFYRTEPESTEGTGFEPLAGEMMIPKGYSSAALYIGTVTGPEAAGTTGSLSIRIVPPPELEFQARERASTRPASTPPPKNSRPSAATTQP